MAGFFKRTTKMEALLAEALCWDRYAIQREITEIKSLIMCNRPLSKKAVRLKALEGRLHASINEKTWRRKNRPQPKYNHTLPIMAKKDEIIKAIQHCPIVIISGETGSGKTTQIPKFCLAADRGIDGLIGCTQPRRIAATTVANRISEELGERLGFSVGYKIRFKSRTGPRPFIKIMTDGILLSETQRDPYLTRYDTIIIDEAHERSLNIDFILGILKTLLQKRDDLKVIITSATIDTEKFSAAFDDAPVIEVSGRMYPVETHYFPMAPIGEEAQEQNYIDGAVQAVDDIQKLSPFGDILIFMPTEQGIRETCDLINGKAYHSVTVFPLFARLSAAEQKRVFKPISDRKIIVATNIAETSITIPGITYVVDTGLARISQYSPRSRTTALPVVPVSKSSADQRKGRCGRMQNGICIRLFSEEDYSARPMFTLPEILRSNLAEVILRMIALKLGNISEFPFIDRPALKNIQDGFDLLLEIGAITQKTAGKKIGKDQAHTLTHIGRLMAKIPVDPRLSRMLIEADTGGCLPEVVVIVSALSIQDPRERPVEKRAEADQAQATFKDPASDFITLLNIWNQYQHIYRKEKSLGSLKRFCKTHFLSFNRMREWRDIHSQISVILKEQSLTEYRENEVKKPQRRAKNEKEKPEKFSSRYAAIHRAILSGFLSNIAVKKEKNIFRATKGREAMVFPGSALFNQAGEWVVAAEMVETSRLFIRTVANINSAWLESLGKELCKYAYINPHWERSRGEVVASEQVSLFGLIIVPERAVGYGRVNADEANDIFIRQALIGRDLKKPLPFMTHNHQVVDNIKDMENRIRRRTLMVDEDVLFDFYKQRLPMTYDIRTLQKRIKEKKGDDDLRMKEADLYQNLPDADEMALYPDSLSIGNRDFSYRYRFDPGTPEDGVTAKIPSSLAAAVPPDAMDWLVPGLLREKILALIRGLPKEYRTRLVPISTKADIIAAEMPKQKTNLAMALSKFIAARFGLTIPAAAWQMDQLPDHLKMRIAITDAKGKVLDTSRNKTILAQKRLETSRQDVFEKAKTKWERTGIRRWDLGSLPEKIIFTESDGIEWIYYIGLESGEAPQKGVNLRLFHRQADAIRSHLTGLTALFSLYFSKELKFIKKQIGLPPKQKAFADYFSGAEVVERQLLEQVKKDLFRQHIRTEKAFEAHLKKVAPRLMAHGQKRRATLLAVLDAYHETRAFLYQLETAVRTPHGAANFLAELRKDLTRLVPENFITLYDEHRMIHLARYITAISIRAQRGHIDLEKDKKRSERLIVYQDRLNQQLKTLSPLSSADKRDAIEDFFWLLEEYKVSLFAQELKTVVPVSPKRLDLQLDEIEQMV